MFNLEVIDLGLTDYLSACKIQKEAVRAVIQNPLEQKLFLVEHSHCYTIGRNGSMRNILVDAERLKRIGIDIFETDRGGDITYHGPGQLVAYPIINLENYRKDVKWFLERLEETVIATLKAFNLDGEILPGFTGVWINKKKICAIGVHVERWVTSHGLALNVNTNLDYFSMIIPCGIADAGVTSMSRELRRRLLMEEVKSAFVQSFGLTFNCSVHLQPHRQE